MAAKIVQIVPRLPPHTDGVGDYGLRLAEQLLKAHQIRTHFLTFQLGIETEPVINGFSAVGLPSHQADTLLSVLPPDIQGILLHYSNYPYLQGKLDAPFWLPSALERAINLRHLKLVVMFHELPLLKWKQLNFLNPIQSIVSRRLAQIAHQVVTDSARFQAILSRWFQRPIPCIPDFATIGEPEYVPPLAERERRLIVFGGTDRRRVYQNSLPKLLQTCQILAIKEICDIGKFLNLKQLYDFADVHLVEMGFQPSEVVSRLMANSLAGCLDYTRFPGDLGKSSVFAAFCAHGLIPICTQYNPSEADGLEMNKHYLVLDEQLGDWDLSQLQSVADNANQWYSRHNLRENAQGFARYF